MKVCFTVPTYKEIKNKTENIPVLNVKNPFSVYPKNTYLERFNRILATNGPWKEIHYSYDSYKLTSANIISLRFGHCFAKQSTCPFLLKFKKFFCKYFKVQCQNAKKQAKSKL